MSSTIGMLLDDEERAVDQTLARWVLKRSGSRLLAAAALAASRAEGRGHACAQLDEPATDDHFDAEALLALRAHAWVGDGSRFTPFVLDARHRFYLWRNWQHETRLAEAIGARCAQRLPPLAREAVAADLDAMFAGMPLDATKDQRAAVAAAPGCRFFVLTGGPGTGKTTTVVRMLLMLLRHARSSGLPEHPSIALAAPTGKAAQRLAQAIAKGKEDLHASLDQAGAHALGEDIADASQVRRAQASLLQQIPHGEALTLHRLLGYRPHDNGFNHDAAHPLPQDIVVVDEASMVDLAMMRQLLDAMRPQALLILLGDPDQLASVDAGSVLSDIVASAAQAPTSSVGEAAGCGSATAATTGMSAHALTLNHTWRAGSGLHHGIAAMRQAPDEAWLARLLRDRVDGDLRLQTCAAAEDLRRCVDRWITMHLASFSSLLTHAIEPMEALASLRESQILCALRDGPFGVRGVNELMARRLAVRFEIDTQPTWYHGRPIIIIRNDYARGLFNGDVGVALDGADGLRVWFELSDRQGHTALRSFSPRALPAHESAWAITIHRSQGSEYQHVAVVLPPDGDSRVLNRQLLYTGVSRAREDAEIWTLDASLSAALHRPVRRQGGLRDRLNAIRG